MSGVIGGVFGVALIVVVICWIIERRKKRAAIKRLAAELEKTKNKAAKLEAKRSEKANKLVNAYLPNLDASAKQEIADQQTNPKQNKMSFRIIRRFYNVILQQTKIKKNWQRNGICQLFLE